MNVQGAYIETEALLGFDKDDYEAGGTGWSGHGTGCSGCTICMMNKVEGKPAMIPSDVSGQGEKRVKLPDPVTVEQAREILKKVREAKRPVINAGNGIRIGGNESKYEMPSLVKERSSWRIRGDTVVSIVIKNT